MTDINHQPARTSTPRIGATVLGYPRIGRNRELKRSLESYWAGTATGPELQATARGVRADAVEAMATAGLDSVPVNTFSYYDQVLDTSVLVGAVPERFTGLARSGVDVGGIDAATYFAMARGTADLAPLEMSKWFDTNYHYLVPEIAPDTAFALNPDKPVFEVAEASERGVVPRPVIVGPWTYLRLSKPADGAPSEFDPLDRLDDLVEVYAELLDRLHENGVGWVQLDEPAVVGELGPDDLASLRSAYERLGRQRARPRLLTATYFAEPTEALPVLAETPVDGLGLDLTRGGTAAALTGIPEAREKVLVLGAVSGRNIWRSDLRRTLAELVGFLGHASEVAVSTSCSLLHVPYDVEVETALDPALRASLAFADQKLGEVVVLQRALVEGTSAVEPYLRSSDEAAAARASIPGVQRDEVRSRVDGIGDRDRRRVPQSERDTAQARRLGLPLLPTTTIGSFPQTSAVRRARAQWRSGRIGHEEYRARMRAEVADVVALQERIGLDVLVHGEPERNDMVQYFAEQLDGYAATESGWVQSYGSRCVRPPILFGDVRRPAPMSTEWITYAQGLTSKPVKAMLTGPVTMLAWAFVRDDQPLATTADQVALALRDEIADLEAAGIGIVQVDEPALRELLPLRESERPDYLAWSVGSFRLATGGAAASTQVHTHLCYSEFGQIIDAIDRLDADVTSIEAARSRMELLVDLAPHGFGGGLGPGVYDIHSPRVPAVDELVGLIDTAAQRVPSGRLWVNPDCGLKTRGYDEVAPALENMVRATGQARQRLGPPVEQPSG